MTMSRGVLRVLLATVAVGGVLVTYGATRNAVRGAMPKPQCNCNVWQDCDAGSNGWKCTSESGLCDPKIPGCGVPGGCLGYCERSEPDGGQPK